MHLTLCHDALGCYAYTDWLRDQGRELEADFLMEVLVQGESGYSAYNTYSQWGRNWNGGDGFGDGLPYGRLNGNGLGLGINGSIDGDGRGRGESEGDPEYTQMLGQSSPEESPIDREKIPDAPDALS